MAVVEPNYKIQRFVKWIISFTISTAIALCNRLIYYDQSRLLSGHTKYDLVCYRFTKLNRKQAKKADY